MAFDKGLGYHDFLYSARPYFSAISLWQWGHALLTPSVDLGSARPYSLLWFQCLDTADQTHAGVYIEQLRSPAKAKCAKGQNELLSLGNCGDCANVKISLEGEKTVEVEIKKKETRSERWVGAAKATIDGVEWSGTGVVGEMTEE